MAVATLTTKGQVTIPKEIRESLKLHTGDKIEIIVTEKREAIIRPISKKVDDILIGLVESGIISENMDSIDLEQIDENELEKRLKDAIGEEEFKKLCENSV